VNLDVNSDVLAVGPVRVSLATSGRSIDLICRWWWWWYLRGIVTAEICSTSDVRFFVR